MFIHVSHDDDDEVDRINLSLINNHHPSQALPPHASSVLISRSGKAPGACLESSDFVLVHHFSSTAWQASFQSKDEETR